MIDSRLVFKKFRRATRDEIDKANRLTYVAVFRTRKHNKASGLPNFDCDRYNMKQAAFLQVLSFLALVVAL